MAVDARIGERCVLVPPEREYRCVHSFGIEHLQPHQQMEILHGQPGHGQEQVRLQLGDDILKRVFAEIGEIHEGRNPRRELDQFLLNQLALRFIFLFLVAQFLFLGL